MQVNSTQSPQNVQTGEPPGATYMKRTSSREAVDIINRFRSELEGLGCYVRVEYSVSPYKPVVSIEIWPDRR